MQLELELHVACPQYGIELVCWIQFGGRPPQPLLAPKATISDTPRFYFIICINLFFRRSRILGG